MKDVPAKPWFAAKRYGYGAGLPIAWQGWVVLALFILGMASGRLVPGLPLRIAAMTALVAGLLVVCALKTEGGWRWRWGDDPT